MTTKLRKGQIRLKAIERYIETHSQLTADQLASKLNRTPEYIQKIAKRKNIKLQSKVVSIRSKAVQFFMDTPNASIEEAVKKFSVSAQYLKQLKCEASANLAKGITCVDTSLSIVEQLSTDPANKLLTQRWA